MRSPKSNVASMFPFYILVLCSQAILGHAWPATQPIRLDAHTRRFAPSLANNMSVANEALPPAANYEDSHDSSVVPEIITSPEAHILPSYTCNGTSLGYNLNGPSCLQAWAQIPLLNTELSFGPRPPKGQRLQWDVGLPLRYLSRT
ncbi:MAG: hypothetical protein Q9223_004383 [Gallowayella weberi]